MKYLVIFTILLTSHLSWAKISVIKPNENHLSFDSLKDSQRKSDVNKDIKDLIDLIPRSKIEEIVKNWIAKDEEVKKVWEYFNSDGFKQKVYDVEKPEEYLMVEARLGGNNVDLPYFVNIVHEILGMKPHVPSLVDKNVVQLAKPQKTGLKGCLDEIRPEIPVGKIILVAGKKAITSSQFRSFLILLRNWDFKESVKALTHNEEVAAVIKDAKANGVDTDAFAEFFKSLSPVFADHLPDIN